MALPKQIELWTDTRIVIRNYTKEDVGTKWTDVGVLIQSIDYGDDLGGGNSFFIEKEQIPELIGALQEFVE